MLLLRFVIGVAEDRSFEVARTLVDDFGVEIVYTSTQNDENFVIKELKHQAYLECFVPRNRYEAIVEYFETQYDGMAIVTC